jgi:hypothetical protein
VIAYFGQLPKINRNKLNYLEAALFHALISTIGVVTLWVIFPQSHLVTLSSAKRQLPRIPKCQRSIFAHGLAQGDEQ